MSGTGDERSLISVLAELFGPALEGETWSGDDAAVLDIRKLDQLLVSTDSLVEGVHFERDLCSLEDVGAKALAVNLSDIAAMGGRPLAAVAAVAGASGDDLSHLASGMRSESVRSICPVVGGNISEGHELSVTIAILGSPSTRIVLRGGARAGDDVYVTGPLGGAAAGLLALRSDPLAAGSIVDAYRRPLPRLAEGVAAASGGASAMIDISDGFTLDLDRIAVASNVGVEIDELPVASGATEADAAFGGDDYELLFTAGDRAAIDASFSKVMLRAPIRIGRVVSDPSRRTMRGEPFTPRGYLHRLA